MKNLLKQVLSQRETKHYPETGFVPAGVLIPLYYSEGEYYIVFTRRTHHVSTHKGEISFPGGGREEKDENLLATALRESAEEIGLVLDDAEILGGLDEAITTVSNYVIAAFVAFIPYPYNFVLNEKEAEELIHIPV